MTDRPLRGLVVCVGFDDLLAITLPRNMRHLAECVVVTSPEDTRTRRVVDSIPGARAFTTDAFTRPDANGIIPRFNKGRAAEEALDAMCRHGWIVSWDADTIFPGALPLNRLRPDRIYGMNRLVLEDARLYRGPESWKLARPHRDDPVVGYFQLWHADDPHIRDARPWFDVSFGHAGGCDEYLAAHWPHNRRAMLPVQCLHLGPVATNWYGRASDRVDGSASVGAEESRREMDTLIKRNDWFWARPGLKMSELRDDGTAPHRLEIEGYDAGRFEIPFIARNRRGKT